MTRMHRCWRAACRRIGLGLSLAGALGCSPTARAPQAPVPEALAAVQRPPHASARAAFLKGRRAERDGRVEEAEGYYRDLVRRDGDRGEAWAQLAGFYERQREWIKAEAVWEKAAELDPDWAVPREALASLALRAGDPDIARAHLEAAVATGARHEARWRLYRLLEIHDPPAAEAMWQAWADRAPADAAERVARGEVALSRKTPDRALDDLVHTEAGDLVVAAATAACDPARAARWFPARDGRAAAHPGPAMELAEAIGDPDLLRAAGASPERQAWLALHLGRPDRALALLDASGPDPGPLALRLLADRARLVPAENRVVRTLPPPRPWSALPDAHVRAPELAVAWLSGGPVNATLLEPEVVDPILAAAIAVPGAGPGVLRLDGDAVVAPRFDRHGARRPGVVRRADLPRTRAALAVHTAWQALDAGRDPDAVRAAVARAARYLPDGDPRLHRLEARASVLLDPDPWPVLDAALVAHPCDPFLLHLAAHHAPPALRAAVAARRDRRDPHGVLAPP